MDGTGIRYETQELLGEGSQGCVFKAIRRDLESGLVDTIALKILHSKTAVDIWRKEFESLRRVRSPYCVQVLYFDRINGLPALGLEFVEGISLSQLGRFVRLTDREIDEILLQTRMGLEDLARAGTFHGDLSPANVLIDRTGQIKLLDFGLANASGANHRVTPEFTSAARLRGEPPSLASDLHSLSLVERYLRSGRPQKERRQSRRSQPQVRRQLARKVDHWLGQQSKKCHPTVALEQTKTSPWTVRALRLVTWVAVTLSLSSSAASFHRPENLACVEIRTGTWVAVSFDDEKPVYAPISRCFPAGAHTRLTWRKADRSGFTSLQLNPGQRHMLRDRDFSH
ncbi:MAG: protein kinase [Bdellovibrionales bacterium]